MNKINQIEIEVLSSYKSLKKRDFLTSQKLIQYLNILKSLINGLLRGVISLILKYFYKASYSLLYVYEFLEAKLLHKSLNRIINGTIDGLYLVANALRVIENGNTLLDTWI